MCSVSVDSLRGRLALVLIVLGLGAVGLIWAKVVQTMADATPVSVTTSQPAAIVWAGRVFETRAALTVWLRSRGTSYGVWVSRHPAESALAAGHAPIARTSAKSTGNRAPATAARFPVRDVFLAILGLLTVVCAAAAVLPAAVIGRFPSLARYVVPHRDILLAGAAALIVGLVVGTALS